MDCIFCEISQGKIPSYKIWEDDHFFAFLDIKPINIGHTLIVPKKHIDYLFDLEKTDYQNLFAAAKKLAGPIKKATDAQRVGMIVEGFGVAHAHLHLVPINQPHELNPHKAHDEDAAELKNMTEKIKKLIK